MEGQNNPPLAAENKLINAKKYSLVVFCFFLIFFGGLKTASAASFSLSPSSGSYTVNQSFSISVYVSSADQAMNAASGVISFPQDKLELASLSKTGSIISLWVQEPSFSNSAGTINFEGIVLNPGFTGSGGKIITLNFKAKSAGNADLKFASGSILANNGQGTNILSNTGSALFTIQTPASAPAAPETTIPLETAGTPPPLKIYSSTHPDSNEWYANSTAKFNWDLPTGITAVRLLVNDAPQAVPTVNYVPPISSKEITGIADGIWYLHVRLKNAQGWGTVSHFRFQIDTQPPEMLIIKFIDGKETENPRPSITFDTVDALSGIEYYKIKIGEGESLTVLQDIVKNNPYTLPPQTPGKHTIIVQAFDRAGNYITGTDEFTIKSITAPTFTDYPSQLQSGEVLTIKGTTYPNSQVVIWLQREKDEPKSQTVKSDENGNFTFIAQEKLEDGTYKVWAEAINEQGAKSNPSEAITFIVKPSTFIKIGSVAITYMAVIIPLIALVVLIGLLLWYTWHRFSLLKKRIRKESEEAVSSLESGFDILRSTINEDLDEAGMTTKKQKTKREKIDKDLKTVEKYIGKEIKDVKEQTK